MQSEKQYLLETYYRNAAKACLKLKEQQFPFITTELIWQVLIYELDCADQPTDIIWHRLTLEEIVILVKAFFLKVGMPVGSLETDVTLSESKTVLEKATIKHGGRIWTIYKFDVDPFPSRPHAHDHDNHVKLHLGTGELYRNSGTVTKLHKKDLLQIREKLNRQFPTLELPQLQL